MTYFGLSETAVRFSIFAVIFLLMTGLEAWMPRRDRRFPRHRRWFANIGVLAADYAAIGAVSFVIPMAAALTALWAETQGWGLFNVLDWPVWLEWVICFVVLDFVIWGQHLVMHKVPLLWRIHRVHHTDGDMDATTALRFHPLEILLSIVVKSGAVLLIGAPALVVVLFEAAVNGAALFNHANYRLPLGLDKWLRLFVVTPDMHRVHHSAIGKETNSNYGFALSVWDRAFRTYTDQPEKGHDGMTIGLAEWQDDAPTRIGWTLALPFRNPPKSPPGDVSRN